MKEIEKIFTKSKIEKIIDDVYLITHNDSTKLIYRHSDGARSYYFKSHESVLSSQNICAEKEKKAGHIYALKHESGETSFFHLHLMEGTEKIDCLSYRLVTFDDDNYFLSIRLAKGIIRLLRITDLKMTGGLLSDSFRKTDKPNIILLEDEFWGLNQYFCAKTMSYTSWFHDEESINDNVVFFHYNNRERGQVEISLFHFTFFRSIRIETCEFLNKDYLLHHLKDDKCEIIRLFDCISSSSFDRPERIYFDKKHKTVIRESSSGRLWLNQQMKWSSRFI